MTAPAARPTVVVLASGWGERFTAAGGQVHKLQALLGGKNHRLDTSCRARKRLAVPRSGRSHTGMGDSIAAAVRATQGAQGWLILPADLPLIQAAISLTVAHTLQQLSLVYPSCTGQSGHPVGFSPPYAAQLANLKGNKGAAQLIIAGAATELIVNDAGCVTNIDTLQALERAQKLLAGY